MHKLWGRPLVAVGLIGLVALILWPILGAMRALAALSALLLILLLHHLFNLSRLQRWLKDSRRDTLPEGGFEWDEIYAALARLLRRQTHIESRLSAALERFQQAGAAFPEGVIVLDETDGIVWCNPRSEANFGLSSVRDRGQQITYLIRNPQFVEYLETRNFHEPLVLRLSRDGVDLILSIQLVPYGARDKLLLSRDITRWERMETTRRDFVANVSHELRTPLSVLRGFLETLSDLEETDPAMLRRSLQLMHEQAERMQHLVEDLLTLSKLESSQSPLRDEFVDVPRLLRSVHRDASTMSDGRHRLTLSIDVEEGVKGSADELRSAFSNLISNAVRYTPEQGDIEIAWGKRNGQLVFSVRDTGIGIEPQHIPRLTERFYRVDRSRSRATGGTGLGLAIVKHVLTRHQAQLEVRSEPGIGSVFSVLFPAARSMAQASAEIGQTAANADAD